MIFKLPKPEFRSGLLNKTFCPLERFWMRENSQRLENLGIKHFFHGTQFSGKLEKLKFKALSRWESHHQNVLAHEPLKWQSLFHGLFQIWVDFAQKRKRIEIDFDSMIELQSSTVRKFQCELIFLNWDFNLNTNWLA